MNSNTNQLRKTNSIAMILGLSIFGIILLSIGYAQIVYDLNVNGDISLRSQQGIIITDAKEISKTGTSQSTILNYVGTLLTNYMKLDVNKSSSIIQKIKVENTNSDNYQLVELLYDTTSSIQGLDLYTNPDIVPQVLTKSEIISTFQDVSESELLEIGDSLNAGETKYVYIKFQYSENIQNSSTNPTEEQTILEKGMINIHFKKVFPVTYISIDNTTYPTTVLENEELEITLPLDVYDLKIMKSDGTVLQQNTDYTLIEQGSNKQLIIQSISSPITIERYFSITYELNGGTNDSQNPEKYLKDDVIILNDPSGDTSFIGWYETSDFSGQKIEKIENREENITLYAKWQSAGSNFVVRIQNLVAGQDTTSKNIITVPSEDSSCTNTFIYDQTSDNNLRYVGSNPCNYVKFNCDSSGNCENWRIIGVMNGISSEPVIKLTKATISTTTLAWDTNRKNTWDTASINTYLNGDYKSSLNSSTLNYILTTKWYIGGVNAASTALQAYEEEKTLSDNTYSIGLFSPSDYGLATSGTDNASRIVCTENALNGNKITATCYNNDYLFQGSGDYQWTISKRANNTNQAIRISNVGKSVATTTQSAYDYRPVVYLKNNVIVTGGNGSANTPFELSIS